MNGGVETGSSYSIKKESLLCLSRALSQNQVLIPWTVEEIGIKSKTSTVGKQV